MNNGNFPCLNMKHYGIKLGFVEAQIFTEIKWNIQRLIMAVFTNKMLVGQ
jgi:hypothetical protein